MNRALFLDRDGVINVNLGYCNKVEDFHYVDGIFDLCREYKEAGYIIIVVTNQAGVAHGFLTVDDLSAIHAKMTEDFQREDCAITAVYASLEKDGPMRKPEPGMLLMAEKQHDILLSESVIIGDQVTDIEAGRRAGLGACILIPPNRLDCVPAARPY